MVQGENKETVFKRQCVFGSVFKRSSRFLMILDVLYLIFLQIFFFSFFFSCGFYLFSIFSHIVAWLRSSFVYILFTQHIYWDVLIQFIHIFLFGITVYFFFSLLPTTREITKSLWISFNHFGHFKESIQNIIINHRKCQESLE